MSFKSKKTILLSIISLLIFCTCVFAGDADKNIDSTIRTLVKKSKIEGEWIHSKNLLSIIYQERDFAPIWLKNGRISKNAKKLKSVIGTIGLEGLNPEFYHIEAIEKIKGDNTESSSAKLDILLTDAFLTLCSNLVFGIADPYELKLVWFKNSKDFDYRTILYSAINGKKVRQTIDKLRPMTKQYLEMRDLLLKYKKMRDSGGWPVGINLPHGKRKIEPGAISPVVAKVRSRLEVTDGPIEKNNVSVNEVYDDSITEAIKRFQKRHGLNEDGVLGKRTVGEMNVSIESRICQIKIALDRMRALSRILIDNKYVLVNIPAFKLDIMENGKSILDMRVIVGKIKYETPMLSDEVETIVFAPKWYVPESIAVEEEIFKLQKDPALFRKRGMRVYVGTDNKKEEIPDYENYDWTKVDLENFNYTIVQDPGAGNALGRIKFLFPNRHSVYLHDTPTKPLFARDYRAFSHGCIRIQKPFELAELLLRDTGKWPREKINKSALNKKEQFIDLKEHLPVHVIYLTAWVDNGIPNFRSDIYKYDKDLKSTFCR